jgi:hypothetical protein
MPGFFIFSPRNGNSPNFKEFPAVREELNKMRKVLIAVDDPKDSKAMLSAFYNQTRLPEEVILLHVQRFQGKSLMIDMLGNAEMGTLKEALKGYRPRKFLEFLKKKPWNSSFLAIAEGRGSGDS